MSIADITAILGAIFGGAGAIIIPVFLYRRQNKKLEQRQAEIDAKHAQEAAELKGSTTVQAFDALTRRQDKEIERLSDDLIRQQNKFRDDLRTSEEKWRKELQTRDNRIAELEAEVGTLQRIIEGMGRKGL